MRILDLKLRAFRGHSESHIEFVDKVNAICGPNGAGKTNILEAIHYLCLSKSFLTSTDTYALRKGADFFEITGRFESGAESETALRLAFVPGEGKKVFVNGAPLARISELVGRVPVVIVSPGDYVITGGGPEERRRFVDNILCQAYPVYLSDLLVYRRTVKQRNALLRKIRSRDTAARDQLDAWTERAAATGARIVMRRHRFVAEFTAFLDMAYHEIERVAERPSIRYQTFATGDALLSERIIADTLRERTRISANREIELSRTLVGPHRDEFVFLLDNLEVRRYASQGQHRTFALALKLAQYYFLKDANEEGPIFLLDDVLDNLDPDRRAVILSVLDSDRVGQSVITASDSRLFSPTIKFDHDANALIRIDAGVPAQAV